MAKERLHPLEAWLLEKNTSIQAFASAHGISFRALYDHFDGQADPRLSTLIAIERATKRAVTVQAVANWFKNLNNEPENDE